MPDGQSEPESIACRARPVGHGEPVGPRLTDCAGRGEVQELARQTAEEQRRQAEEARMRRTVLDKQVGGVRPAVSVFVRYEASVRYKSLGACVRRGCWSPLPRAASQRAAAAASRR